MKKALKFDERDNVVIALEATVPGDEISVNGEASGVTAADSVPQGHKIALRNIAKGETIYKYGHPIGLAAEDISAGSYVHVHNVLDPISTWKENYLYQYNPDSLTEIDDSLRLAEPPKLYGYRRRDGRVGFRNHLVVLSTAVCANKIVSDIEYKFRDVVAITNPSGCVILPNEVERIKAILLGIARNPNVGAVIFAGLGCESVEAEWFYDQVKDEKPCAFVRSQNYGSTEAAYEDLEKLVISMKAELDKQQREGVSVADICLGVKCGASDWTTAVASNPAIGYASDIVVKNGGTSLLGETVGWYGGEGVLTKQSRTKETADKIIDMLTVMYDRAKSMGRSIEESNPAPGNIAGGITTLKEKALGNVKKGGTAPVEGALDFGEYPTGKGLYVVDNPGLDPLSLLGLTCSGATVLLYSTGRGTPVGNPIAPAIKLTGSPDAMKLMGANMDADLTGISLGHMSIAEGGRLLFDKIVAACNGEPTIAEKLGHREYAFPLLMGAL